jgi:putative tributyrin esterase
MALLHVNCFSRTLGMSVSFDAILPERSQGIGVEGGDGAGPHPVLWLLHGASDDHTIWQRRTSIERYVAPLGLAVIMPSVELSFYSNMEHGFRYFDFVTQELPEICRGFFHLSDRREDTYVAGLSMGGYGALKMALSFPDRYAAAGCLSAGNFFVGPAPAGEDRRDPKSPMNDVPGIVFGLPGRSLFDLPELLGSEHDLFHLAERATASGSPMPRIFHACGTEDFLVENARRTRDYFGGFEREIDYEYHEGPGAHGWDFWDVWIQRYLEFAMVGRRTP